MLAAYAGCGMGRALRWLMSAATFWRPAPRLVKITVWRRMTVIDTITDAATLAAFDALWSEQIRQPRGTKTTYRYSFDLGTQRGTRYPSTRWVYNADGFAKVMVIPNIAAEIPVYRIPAAERLNRLVGLGDG